jgi:hypothetical protein
VCSTKIWSVSWLPAVECVIHSQFSRGEGQAGMGRVHSSEDSDLWMGMAVAIPQGCNASEVNIVCMPDFHLFACSPAAVAYVVLLLKVARME